jgi:KRAB domain-containing zinc finger protein
METERINDFLICSICKRHFYTKLGFQIHTKKEHQQEQDSLKHNSVSLEQELLKKSVEETNLVAENESFSKNCAKPREETEKDLESHNKKESQDKIKQCVKSSSYQTNLNHHSKEVNEKILPVQCQLCKKGFVGKWSLKLHIKGVHENIKFQCQQCDKNFSYLNCLNRHSRQMHEKIIPFLCHLCKKSFADKAILKHHIQKVHENIKYHCQKCEKHFSQKCNLKRHVKIVHENIKPFHCQQCDKKFSQKISLQRHIKSAHENMEPS